MANPVRGALTRIADVYLRSRVLRCAALVVFGYLVFVLITGHPRTDAWATYRIDFDVYRLGGQAFRDGADLYGTLHRTVSGADLYFTYPPIAAVIFSLFTFIEFETGVEILTGLSIAALLVALWLVIRELGVSALNALWLTVPAAIFAVLTIPVRQTVEYGQVNLILMALVLIDLFLGRGRWWQGALVGIALSIKLTPAVFLAYFLMRRDWRAIAVGIGTAVVVTGLGFALAPRDSVTFWTSALRNPDRIGENAFAANQSLSGALHRLGLDGAEPLVWFVLCAAIGLACLALMRRLFHRGQDLTAALVMGLYALVASPVSWGHHFVWATLAVIAVGAAAVRARNAVPAVLLAAFALAGAWIYQGATFLWLPHPPQQNPHWTLPQQAFGSLYLWWVLAALALAWLASRSPAAT